METNDVQRLHAILTDVRSERDQLRREVSSQNKTIEELRKERDEAGKKLTEYTVDYFKMRDERDKLKEEMLAKDKEMEGLIEIHHLQDDDLKKQFEEKQAQIDSMKLENERLFGELQKPCDHCGV